MFNRNRGPLLFWALGIAGAVVAAAGTGTWLFTRNRKRTRAMIANAKRVITHTTHKRKPTVHAKANHAKTNHARTNHATHHATAR